MTRRAIIALSALAGLLITAGCGDDERPPASDAADSDISDIADTADTRVEVDTDAARDTPPDITPDVAPPEGACADWDPLRRAYFGDLHVHTALSLDANLQGTRLGPADAYRFARGEAVGIQPHDAEGNALRTIQLARPLDFAAVTDHAEFLGLITLCQDPEAPAYDSAECTQYREDPNAAFIQLNALTAALQNSVRWPRLCGDDGSLCLPSARNAWRATQDAAAAAHDTSDACGFTTLLGYEWSGGPGTENLHRNVIFRSAVVPDAAVSYFDEPYPEGLWDALQRDCIDAGTGCDVLAIPHNSNLSNGRMFRGLDRDGQPFSADYAAARIAMEPLVEVFQHKGDSECWPGSPVADELCGFEKMPYNSLATANLDLDVVPKAADFIRDALGFGLQLEESLGVNPFGYGFIASTDTHIAAPGSTAEGNFPGHGGAGQGNRDELPAGLPDSVAFNPGGLAVVWAEENSRGAIFDALRRRETYGTSGPRISVRFFGGWGYDAAMCEDPALVRHGYEGGVPMGGVLPNPGGSGAPTFVLSALADPGAPALGRAAAEPATPLQRIQIVKGWLVDGEFEVRVFDVGGDATAGTDPGVDMQTCEPMDAGSASLCSVWTDPDFDPAQRAFYYARVVQIPTCRWTTHQCVAAGVDCSDRGNVPEAWASCCDERFESIVQERAWTSPIWYRP